MWIWMVSVFPYVWLHVAYGARYIQLIPQHPVINGSVTLSLNLTGITEKITSFLWYKGPKRDRQNQILRYVPDTNMIFNGSKKSHRITASYNGSLHIKNLHITDEGEYTARIETRTSSEDRHVNLTIYDLVRKPIITPSHSPVQEDDFYVLSCVTANAEKITWRRQNKSLPQGAIISADGRTVTFANITRSDAGGYQCEAENPVSKEISHVFTLTVLYLVRKPIITPSHSPVQEDDFFVLTCVTANAEKITWRRQNKSLPQGAIISADGRTVTFANITRSDAGGYQCEAENPVSKEISHVFTLTVLYIGEGEDTAGLSSIVIAGIVCGTILGIILILSVTYLLHRLYVLPLREAQGGKPDQSEIYENVMDLAPKSEEPIYKDLEFKSENVYTMINL